MQRKVWWLWVSSENTPMIRATLTCVLRLVFLGFWVMAFWLWSFVLRSSRYAIDREDHWWKLLGIITEDHTSGLSKQITIYYVIDHPEFNPFCIDRWFSIDLKPSMLCSLGLKACEFFDPTLYCLSTKSSLITNCFRGMCVVFKPNYKFADENRRKS